MVVVKLALYTESAEKGIIQGSREAPSLHYDYNNH